MIAIVRNVIDISLLVARQMLNISKLGKAAGVHYHKEGEEKRNRKINQKLQEVTKIDKSSKEVIDQKTYKQYIFAINLSTF